MDVSVVIPVKNGAKFVAEAVGSALRQPEVGRVVVVDDGSVDDSAKIVAAIADARVALIGGGRVGVSAARNRGFGEAARLSGPQGWVMFLDADDRLREGAIARLLAAATDDCVAVYGDYERIDERGAVIGWRSWLRGRAKPSGDILRALLSGNFIVNGGVMLMKVAAMRAIGGFDESLRYNEDWHAFCRLASLGPIRYLDATVLDYRVHGASAMMRGLVSFQNFSDALDRVFADPRIKSRLLPAEAGRLHAEAEAHLRMYRACQAVRSHVYLSALPEAAQALRSAPRRAPKTMMRILAAAAGF
jgi:glycosyltransferase involved in cell wall biosynthesis